MSINQKEIKIELRITLNNNRYKYPVLQYGSPKLQDKSCFGSFLNNRLQFYPKLFPKLKKFLFFKFMWQFLAAFLCIFQPKYFLSWPHIKRFLTCYGWACLTRPQCYKWSWPDLAFSINLLIKQQVKFVTGVKIKATGD